MVLACSVEIVSVIRDEYRSLKSNPANGHYGYAVVFHGADPVERIDLEFPVTRLFTRQNVIATTYVGQWFQTAQIVVSLRNLYNCLALPVKLCADLTMEVADPIALPGHPETIVKVKTPPGSQFNIICYWTDIPGVGVTTLEVDPSDGSDGLDEYPEPDRNSSDDPWSGNPPTTEADPSNDPRDYGVADGGADAPGVTNFVVSYDAYTDPQYSDETVALTDSVQIPGQWAAGQTSFVCDETAAFPPVGTYCFRWRIILDGYGVIFDRDISVASVPIVNSNYFPQG